MGTKDMPQTPAREVMVSLDDSIRLDGEDGVQDVMRKGLYGGPGGNLVLICEQSEVVALTTAGELRERVLPRSWHGPLKEWITSLPAPPEVTADTPVAELDFFVQDQQGVDWVLVVDGESGEPAGALDRATILDFLPPFDMTAEVYRSANLRLWGDGTVRHYYYCPVEKRMYGPHAVQPDPQGRMRDRKGHIVEVRAVPEESQGEG